MSWVIVQCEPGWRGSWDVVVGLMATLVVLSGLHQIHYGTLIRVTHSCQEPGGLSVLGHSSGGLGGQFGLHREVLVVMSNICYAC